MSGFETDRANRKAAWALFEGRLGQVKADLSARSIKGRIIDKAKGDALAMADEAVAVAKDNKGLVAATIAALIVWAFRAPLLEFIATKRIGQAPVQPEPANDDFADTTEEQAQ
ncbi:MAG: hypothetical protein ACK44O_14595 [Novosphingobium sp.]|jgi:hypothetical protein|uniref:hypothetical protein n=1 Tax=Novosphingobium sp. TaxID=1874826 RepID=UPI003919E23C|nr:hypothetical protein [Novosphingobium sp.]